jgi:subtilisin family serine protease
MLVGPPNGPEEGFMSPRSTGRSTIFAINLCTVLAAGGFLLSACQGAGTPVDPNAPGNPAPAINAAVIPGAFIVVFNRSVADAPGLAKQLVTDHGGTMRFAYSAALKGFAADLPAQAVEALKHNPNVAYVEPDGVVQAFGTESPTPSWGLDRVDQRALPLSNSYTWGTSGAGVSVYIIDTGIRTTHQDFGGRAVWDFNAVKGNDPDTDCMGHGTHVAGTVGGTTYGVAKGVSLHAVKVLDCTGSGRWSWVIAGIDWVTAHAAKPAVANMSIGGDYNQAVNDAVEGSIRSGVSYAIAAGNSSTDACTFSPASAPDALTVGATTKLDGQATYSNFGSCVDLYAPGTFILSDWNTSDTTAVYLSGTSMATPHVTGAAALYLETHPTASPAAVASYLLAAATRDRITNAGTGSPNLLLFIGDSASVQSPPSGGSSCVPSKSWSNNCK